MQLIRAAWANDVEGARRLIAAGADVNAKDDTEQSAFLIATSEGHLALLELTLAGPHCTRRSSSVTGRHDISTLFASWSPGARISGSHLAATACSHCGMPRRVDTPNRRTAARGTR
jgi:ankyrin repeat protein